MSAEEKMVKELHAKTSNGVEATEIGRNIMGYGTKSEGGK